MHQSYEITMAMNRVIFMGDPNVGKTAILHRIINGAFNSTTNPTTSATYHSFQNDPNDDFILQFWDTAGTERYRSINRIYYRDAVAAIITFDFTSKKSFDSIDSWLNDFIENGSVSDAIIILVGNKYDLISSNSPIEENHQNIDDDNDIKNENYDDDYVVDENVVAIWATSKSIPFFAVSAKSGEGIKELISFLFQAIPRKTLSKTTSTTILNETSEKKKKCC
ncbi:GTP-binding protein YPT52 [Tritrichomonas foetus]|uniref:GTP-binding protein YPT52 n=1 Tax=Tritrichomonas foetus TaxID=1144522 RepID=A0A1J4K8J4_9EUKA|nr:GTP-binding protein YPT52 [Tritrichomonas foetus]|eukprot:OHT05990.1 GTP-binding protein YPT52 [Tritrichomonas foetus]